MSNRVVYFNGSFVPESEARVSIFDSALMYGDMAFDMTRTFGQTPFRLGDHIERIYAALKLMEIDCGMSMDEMEATTVETLQRNLSTEPDDVDWQIMHDISRGPLPVYRTVFPDGLQPTVSINCWPLITHMGSFAKNYETGVSVGIPAQQALPAQLVDAKAKTRSRLHYQIANLQAARMGDIWPLLMDTDGFIAEGTGWNIFFVRGGILYTPQPRNILLGVSRRVTMELAAEEGIEVREVNWGRYEALQAEEMFCTGTSYSLCHANRFEGQLIGDGSPGPIFQKLMAAWQRRAGVDFVAQAKEYARRLPEWEQREMEESKRS